MINNQMFAKDSNLYRCTQELKLWRRLFKCAGLSPDFQKTEGHANDGTALFDARAFNLPVDEVCNYLIWRQQDCERNALGSFARAFYSHKQLEGKKHPDLVAMLQEKNISWENMSPDYKRGVIAYKVYSEGQEHPEWTLDKNTPVFSTNKEFIQEILTKL